MEDQWSGSDTESIDSSIAEEEDCGSSITQKVVGINENGNFSNGFWLNDYLSYHFLIIFLVRNNFFVYFFCSLEEVFDCSTISSNVNNGNEEFKFLKRGFLKRYNSLRMIK